MLANTYEIRRGAQQFAFAADGMRQKASQVEQLDSHLSDQWKGQVADVFHQVAERLKDDIHTASDAFERAYSALDTLANQLDQSNHLYQQSEQMGSQIQSLEWTLFGADEQRRLAVSEEIASLLYRKNSLENEAQSIQYQANAAASSVFNDIASMVNRLHFFNVTSGTSPDHSSVLDKVGNFFAGLWKTAEQDFEKVKSSLEEDKKKLDEYATENPFISGQIGFAEGVLEAGWDTVKASWDTTMMLMGLEPQKEMKLAKEIFRGAAHPVQTAENLLDGAKVLFSTVTQSFDDEVIHGNSYTANKWLGYATVMIAQALATDGEGGATYVARATEFVKQVPRFGKKISSNIVKGNDEKLFTGVQETEGQPQIKDEGAGKTIDQSLVDRIVSIEKGQRPDPATYLSQDYITSHLAKFDDGVTKISVSAPSGVVGPPGGTFVMPKSVADDLIAKAGGNVTKLEEYLSLEPGTLGESPVRIDIPSPDGLRMSSGNERGANSQWIPGGYTGGGIPEATIDPASPGMYFVSPIFK